MTVIPPRHIYLSMYREMGRYCVATYYYDDDDVSVDDVIALGNSIRTTSTLKTIVCGTSVHKRFYGSYDIVVRTDTPIDHILSMDEWDTIVMINPRKVMDKRFDFIASSSSSTAAVGGSPDLRVMVVKPSRLISRIQTFGRDLTKVREFFVSNKYEWKTLSSVYDQLPSDITREVYIRNKYIPSPPKKEDLIPHLRTVLSNALGEEKANRIIDSNIPIFTMAFTHKSVNPVFNYDNIEAYGDGFLKSAYMWLLSRTPGIIDSGQITTIADYFGSAPILADIATRLDLPKYIISNDPIDEKTKSDCIESLIAAIGISWASVYGGDSGDEGIRKFVDYIYSFYTIDVANYKAMYASPIIRFNTYLQQLHLNRSLVNGNDRVENNQVIYTLIYSNTIIGVGIQPIGTSLQLAKKSAKNKAYQDALTKKSLDKFIRQ
jgi:dsRNA-specific ribonuclease